MNYLTKIKRYAYMGFYSKTSQLINRIFSGIKRPLSYRFSIKTRKKSDKQNLFIIDSSASSILADDLLNNEFTFLNDTEKFLNEIEWSDKSKSSLWNFNLNYFEYLVDLTQAFKETENIEYLDKGVYFVESWIKNSTRYNKITWAPYTVSLRLLNWVTYYSYLITNNLLEKIPKTVLNSILIQVTYLKKNLEKDVLGNHLFENLKTIVLVEYFLHNLNEANKYIKILGKALAKQIHKDGCHFEKSISYHIIILNGLIDLITIVKNTDLDLNTLIIYANKMISFYKGTGSGTTNYPLLNDSNYSMTERYTNLDDKIKIFRKISYKQHQVKTLNTSSGYIIRSIADYRIIIDAGTNGPNYLMAHSHNDILSYNLTIHNHKVVIDTGVGDYNKSNSRHYARSTIAHNTVQVGNIEQSDNWSIFRTGYRPQKIVSSSIEKPNEVKVEATLYHKKYKQTRVFELRTDSITIKDKIISKSEQLNTTCIHLSPDIILKKESNYLILSYESNLIYLYFFENNAIIPSDKIHINETDYYPRFGRNEKKQTLLLKTKDNYFGYIFSKSKILDVDFDNYVNYNNV